MRMCEMFCNFSPPTHTHTLCLTLTTLAARKTTPEQCSVLLQIEAKLKAKHWPPILLCMPRCGLSLLLVLMWKKIDTAVSHRSPPRSPWLYIFLECDSGKMSPHYRLWLWRGAEATRLPSCYLHRPHGSAQKLVQVINNVVSGASVKLKQNVPIIFELHPTEAPKGETGEWKIWATVSGRNYFPGETCRRDLCPGSSFCPRWDHCVYFLLCAGLFCTHTLLE